MASNDNNNAKGNEMTTTNSNLTINFVRFLDDDSYSVYLDGVWLANEATKDEARTEAIFIIRAYQNGASWARTEFPGLAGKV